MSFFGGTTQVDKLILQVQGRDELRLATADLEKQAGVVQKVLDTHKAAGTYQSTQYVQEINTEVASLKVLQDQVDRLRRSFGGGTSAAAKAQGVNNLSYAIQDFAATSGGFAQKLNSITNNIQTFAVSMGAGGWVFVGITSAMAAIQAFVNNFDKFEEFFTGTAPVDPKKLAEQAKALKKKADEMEQALQQIRDEEDQADDSAKVAERVKNASIAVGGSDRVRKSLADQMAGQSPEIRAADEALAKAQAEHEAAQKALANAPVDPDFRLEFEARAGGAEVARNQAQAAAQVARQAVNARALELIQKARAGDPAAARELADRFPNSPFVFATPEQVATDEARAQKTKEVNKLVDEYARGSDDIGNDMERDRAHKTRDVRRLEEEYQARNDQIDQADANAMGRAQGRGAGQGVAAHGAAHSAVQGMLQGQRDAFAQAIDDQTGGQFSPEAVAAAAQQAQGMVNQGVAPMEAAARAMQTLLQTQAMGQQRMLQLQGMFQGMGQQAAAMQQNMMQAPAMGGFSGMPGPWPF